MKKTALLLLAAILCLAAAGQLNPALRVRRDAFRPPHQTDLREAPPLVVFTTVALGGFRGILADLLWLRVSALQEEGKYFEITQLSDWITKLEPTFAEVWGFHAWNMAYNISVLFDKPEDRWRWVENGVRMLREDGIRCNPGDPKLYWELGWLFYHKIAGSSDSAAGYYQERLFEKMAAFLPDGRLSGAAAGSADGVRAAFRMDPAAMAAMDGAIGPLDWRLPESHALYWAWVGRQAIGAVPDLMLERLFYQSMMASASRGGIVREPDRNVKVRLVRIDLLPKAEAVLREAARRFPEDDGIQTATGLFIRKAIVLLYAFGEDAAAARLLEEVRRTDPTAPAGVAAFVTQQADAALLVGPEFVDESICLYFKAEQERRAGRVASAARLDETADRLLNGIAQRIAQAGQALPFSRESLRERGRGQAAALFGKKEGP